MNMNIGDMQIPTTHRKVMYKNDIKFMEKFELLKEFKEEFNRFPKAREVYKGVKLGMWCSDLRGKKWRHSKDRIDLLNSIGFVWDVRKHQWDTNFNLVKEFKEEFGKMPSSTEIYKVVKLGMWCDIQRHYYNHSIENLSKERIDLLNSIGFIWDIQIDRNNSNFELLKEYKEEFGKLPSTVEEYKGVKLGLWCSNIRVLYKNGNMTEDLYKKLRGIGFMFDYNKEKWEYNFELLKEFKEKFGRLPKQYERYKNVELGFWMYNNMSRSKDEEKKKLLRSVGVNI